MITKEHREAVARATRRVVHELRLSKAVFRDYGYQHQDKAEAAAETRDKLERERKAKRNFDRASACEAALDDYDAAVAADAAIIASLHAKADHFADAGKPIIDQIGKLLGDDPVCGGRVCQGTVEAIAGLVGNASGSGWEEARELAAALRKAADGADQIVAATVRSAQALGVDVEKVTGKLPHQPRFEGSRDIRKAADLLDTLVDGGKG